VESVFEMLERLQRREGKTIIVVEQNAKKGLQFADIGYVIVSGRLALADQAADLLKNPRVSRLFLGG
jgi:branched-chain amino acid transport system ATP-binding protein